MTLSLLLLILAAIAFACAAVNVPARVNLVAVGLLLWVVAAMVGPVQLG